MLIQEQPPIHLTYCLNVHAGESWADVMTAIRYKTLAIRNKVLDKGPFGLGLRLSHHAAFELARTDVMRAFRAFLEEQQMYVFTINGFPYGNFHDEAIKANVYAPDWRTVERRNYTVVLADILAQLLPEHLSGSISTVPCSYRSWPDGLDDLNLMLQMLLDTIAHLALLHDKTGKFIQLALEPEPYGYLESVQEGAIFINNQVVAYGRDYIANRLGCSTELADQVIRNHLGLCLDTCHMAVQFEEPVQALGICQQMGIQIPKVQLTSCLEVDLPLKDPALLDEFCEPTYLHQTSARTSRGVRYWKDLPKALHDIARFTDGQVLRCHYHVPLSWQGDGPLRSTRNQISPAFIRQLKKGHIPHLEIETYTFDILPSDIKSGGIIDGVAAEYQWFLRQWADG
ncbi:MAG: hypothetical protein EOM20_11515 [Spartobacteria bacterium]|nr:hypothetical protein [Spartobacteria bacterium]